MNIPRDHKRLLGNQALAIVQKLQASGPQTVDTLARIIDWVGREDVLREYLPYEGRPKKWLNGQIALVCLGRFPIVHRSGPGPYVYAIAGDTRPIPSQCTAPRTAKSLAEVLEKGPLSAKDIKRQWLCSLQSAYRMLEELSSDRVAEVVFELPRLRGAALQLWGLSVNRARDRSRLLARRDLIHRVLQGCAPRGMTAQGVHDRVPVEEFEHVEGLLLLLRREKRARFEGDMKGGEIWFAA